jgi:MraZ protein
MQLSLKGTYVSTFEHSFDAKGRLTVPAEWRTGVHEKDLHLFPSREGCVKVYPASWLAEQLARMAALRIDDPQRKTIEALASFAQVAAIDEKTGRIMVKEPMRKHAGLAKDAVLVGSGPYFQIWDKAKRSAVALPTMSFEEAANAAGI